MPKPPPRSKPVKAGPTKAFFVEMLTRDIELSDAILDLLDNCVDGVARSIAGKPTPPQKPYKGYEARITASPDMFSIVDNCGGISEEIAQKEAFRLGRPDTTRDSDLETVGMYGIGMKRAIFKLGTECVVKSQPATGPYTVEITSQWMANDDDWELELNSTEDTLDQDGTSITVTQLRPGISQLFNQERSTFLADLEKQIARHYALIIDKGFSVFLNGVRIRPVELSILAPPSDTDNQIAPYVFTGTFGNVSVDIVVGFYRPLMKEQELADATMRSTRDHAGWTIVCNQRIVLYNDKTALTGWGTRTVPAFHNQFICIAGVVTFRSKHSQELPLNTTKRGLDTSSQLYHIVLEYMQDGLKKFTAFTNHWKGRESETKRFFKDLEPIAPGKVVKKIKGVDFRPIRKHKDMGTAKYFAPQLPRPAAQERQPQICFPAKRSEIELLMEHFYGEDHVENSDLGRRCFDECLYIAKEQMK